MAEEAGVDRRDVEGDDVGEYHRGCHREEVHEADRKEAGTEADAVATSKQ